MCQLRLKRLFYQQRHSIPIEFFRQREPAGYPIGAALERLVIPPDLANAYLTLLDIDACSHVSLIFVTSTGEHAELLKALDIMGQPLIAAARSKPRQDHGSWRGLFGVNTSPTAPTPTATTITITPNIIAQAPAPKEEVEPLMQVALNDVVRQGSEVNVPAYGCRGLPTRTR